MQIVIPMSGFGERFRKAGYDMPKPLICVEGKPIIAHVINMFPDETDFVFICNQEHLDNPYYSMESIIKLYCPTGRIIGIAPHKLGPIYAVLEIEEMLDPTMPVIVNYCDFTCYWDWTHFKNFIAHTKCLGAIPAYRGFHPHSLGSTNYAYIKERDGWILDIQEKQPFTDERMDEYASSGTYYFASVRLMTDSFRLAMQKDFNVGGEYYVSLAYKLLLQNNDPIAVYPLQHFMQWGTPEDVDEYNSWSNLFRLLTNRTSQNHESHGSTIVPMAGLGQRFIDANYSVAKPLILVSGSPMVAQAVKDLPASKYHVFVLRAGMKGCANIIDSLKKLYPKSFIKTIDGITEGQACTVLLGLDLLEGECKNDIEPITIGACDNGVLYDLNEYQKIFSRGDVDIIVWGIRGHPSAIRHPEMYGWIDHAENYIKSISVKKPLLDPRLDPIVLGTFTFKRFADLRCSINSLIARNERVNGEFYLDSCINDAIKLGLRCYFFEVDAYIGWGTPNDLQTFEYWQSCFHKWAQHPYRLENDDISVDQKNVLEIKYQAIVPPMLPARIC